MSRTPTALDAPLSELDDHERSFVSKIREHGWFRTGILADDDGPGFSFTTGFWVNADHPELLMFSMKDEIAHDVFWDLFRDAKKGASLPVGRRTENAFGNAPAYVFRIAERQYRNFLGWSCWFYRGTDFPCLQIVWPDRAGIFPWEPGFDAGFDGLQPDLTERGWANEIGN
jgi:hypothetical protein